MYASYTIACLMAVAQGTKLLAKVDIAQINAQSSDG